MRCALAACALCWGAITAAARPVVADPSTDDRTVGALAGYIARDESSYQLREVSTGHIGRTEYVELILTSQAWRGIPWKHQLFVLRPSRMRSESRQAFLLIHGGRWKEEYEGVRSQAELPREARLFARLAETMRSPFTVSGASKRGWTSWLTAAIDTRVAAVAPMVIDILYMLEQIDHQKATWGELSDEIRARLRSEPSGVLLSIVDPYSYRDRLTQPKLILLATNDRYWPLDALRLYWTDLPEPKHVLYFPNQGHDFRDFDRLIGSISALHRYSERRESLLRLSWKFAGEARQLVLTVQADRAPHRVRLWSARSSSRDFRSVRWVSRSCARFSGRYVCHASLADAGYTAMFAELSFKDRREPAFSLSTTVCIARPASAADRLDCCT